MPERAIEVPYRCLRGGLGVVAYTCLRSASAVLWRYLRGALKRCLRGAKEMLQRCHTGALEVP